MSDPASQNSIAGKGRYDCHSQFTSGAGIGPPGTVPHSIDLNCARNRPVAHPHPLTLTLTHTRTRTLTVTVTLTLTLTLTLTRARHLRLLGRRYEPHNDHARRQGDRQRSDANFGRRQDAR